MTKLLGTKPNQAPTNADLGDLAYQDGANSRIGPITVTGGNVGIGDTTGDHYYYIARSELTADRTATLPLLTGHDTFVFQDHEQKLDNKTIVGSTTEQENITHSVSGALALDVANGHRQKVTASANITALTITGHKSGEATSVFIEAVNWGSVTVTVTGILTPSGAAPTFTASGTDHLSLEKDSAGVYSLRVLATNVSAAA
jgi:hypothetical protein